MNNSKHQLPRVGEDEQVLAARMDVEANSGPQGQAELGKAQSALSGLPA
jgi:hypothetical protein